MAYYLVLVLATVTIASLAAAVWKKTRQAAFLLGFAFLYYWSLYGGWLVVNRGMGADRSYKFEYMFYRLFPVYLDEYYLSALILYAVFIVSVQLTVLVVARGPVQAGPAQATRIVVSHPMLLAIAGICALGAYALAWRAVTAAIAAGTSAYGALSVPGLIPLATVYQILHQSGLTFALIGVSILLCGDRARYIVGRRGRSVIGYLVVLGALGGLSVVMGNRSMLVFGAAGAALFYLVNAERPSRALIAGVLVAGVASMSLLGIIRGAGALRELGGVDVIGKLRYVVADAMTQDVEPFAAHASMYGTLQKHVPLTYGTSFLWLATSVIPAAVRPALVPISYEHYATNVGAFQEQGFTIHHATGWYLNFGVPGLVLGAVVLGWVWAALFNRFRGAADSASHFGRVFSTLTFWTFTAYIPILIRAGPEGYKGATVEAMLVPTLMMVASTVTLARHAGRLRLVPRGTPTSRLESTAVPGRLQFGRSGW